MTVSAFDIEDIYPELGIDLYSLQAIMFDVENIPVSDYIDEPDSLFYGTSHKDRYAQGAVGERSAHLTIRVSWRRSPRTSSPSFSTAGRRSR